MGRDDYDDRYTDEYDNRDTGYTGGYATGYETGYTGAYETGYTGEYDASREYSAEYSAEYSGRALIPRDESDYLPALIEEDESGPVVIPGSGVPMGEPLLGSGHRSLTMRVAVLTLMAALLVSSLFAVTPLGSSANGSVSSFQALSGAVVLHSDVSYLFYIVQNGDTIESIAKKFHCQIGGIYKLNQLYADQDVPVGKTIKIPTDPRYGADYIAPRLYDNLKYTGQATLGPDWFNSYAGDPPPEVPCGIDGHGVPTAYGLISPNPGSSFVRGYSWYHNGDDIAAPRGNPIHAAHTGEVLFAGWTNTGFGFAVKLNNCYHLSTLYGHMDRVVVKAGDVVQQGDIIGYEGSTGWSTGPHLHFSVFVDNQFVDPLAYYSWNRAKLTGNA